ncbi:MAG TPA: adenylate/guanylate cyclase domain-containing protein [Solirubrobacteraceae bacterium]
MAIRCPRCGSEAQDGMNFCGVCGAPLHSPRTPTRERRLVSVLFCDLVGFTTFSETRDPEDVRDVLGQYFAAARLIVRDYGGEIEKFIGDAVMALWGAPIAREDDAERAVRAGLEIVQAVAVLAGALSLPELRVRVGVLTGEAAVEVGSAEEGMVTGDAVNTAARIQSIADPETVLVDDVTRVACERAVEFEDAGLHTVKGRTVPVRVWRALGIREDAGAVRSGTIEPPLVGRDAQLEAVAGVARRVSEGPAALHIVGVIGDAGLGKSRLSWELERRIVQDLAFGWHRGRSVAFGEGSGLSALAEIMRAALGIGRADSPEGREARVQEVLAQRFADDQGERVRVGAALRRLLGLDSGRELIEQGALFSAWRVFLERLADERPLVLVFEEVQLADQALLNFIAHLGEWSRSARILVLVLSRPEPRLAQWREAGERIELEPLSEAQMDELVVGTVDGAPEVLLAAIRADGGGVPLYAVETLRALADQGILAIEGPKYVVRGAVGELSVPPTIRKLVSSRLDRIEPDERRVLFAGAVLGDTFAAAGAAAVAGTDEHVARQLLDGLVAKALLEPDKDGYAFTQGVVRRVSLARLSRRELKRSHMAAVEHLSRLEETEAELASVLAGHLLAAVEADPRADDVESIKRRTVATLTAAAERAAAVGALNEALSLFDRAVALTDDERERAAIFEAAGFVGYRAGDIDAATARYRSAYELHAVAGRAADGQRVRAKELRAAGYVQAASDVLPAARELYYEVRDQRDPVAALAGNVLAYTLYQSGQSVQALGIASETASIAEECGDHGELAFALGVQGSALQQLERQGEAIAVKRRVVAVAEAHDARRVAPASSNLSVALASVGRFTEAVDHASQAVLGAERAGERFFERYARLALGRALCSLGDWDRAVAEIESVKDAVPPFYVAMAIAPLVVIALGRGQERRVAELVAEYDGRVSAGDTSVFESDFRIVRAAALARLSPDETPEIARLIPQAVASDYAEWTGWLAPIVDRLVMQADAEPLESALAALREPGAMKRTSPVLAQSARLEAHLAARAGEDALALDRLREAARLAGECGMRFEHAVIVLECAEHAASCGEPVDGAALGRAQETFVQLAAVPWRERAERHFTVAPPADIGQR